jgi:hypothetical protein
MSKWMKRIGLALLAILIVIQFFGISKENPPVIAEQEFMNITAPPADVAEMLKTACYDCHSHNTEYPWYSNIAPVSWWLANHIEHGREELNFSEWGTYDRDKAAHKAEESAEEVEEKHMPITPYLITHSGARLSDEQRKRLASWFMALADGRDASERIRESDPNPVQIPADEEEHEHEEGAHGHGH